jgi:diguanylate cyclase (GGDEF)-like protein
MTDPYLPTEPAGGGDLFEFAPISLWQEDYSAVKRYLEQLRAAGVTDLRAYLALHPQAVLECIAGIRVSNVNRKTVELFRAASKRELLDNLGQIFRDEMPVHFMDELLNMWDGKLTYVGDGINYALDGEPLEIRLHWTVLPGAEANWERVLVAIEDVSARRRAERALAASEARFRGLFENAPISLWEEDFAPLKHYLDNLRAQGVEDLREYLAAQPRAVDECMALLRVLDVNRRTLELYHAASKAELASNLGQVLRDDVREYFHDELAALWDGQLSYQHESLNYALNGDPINILLHWAVLPGSEATLEHVLVSIEDITARKKAENYLKYLGTHDVLTGLHNRAYFEEELARLTRGRHFPVSIVVADLDSLKPVNDNRGHAEGDKLIRRAAEVLLASVRAEDMVTRVGGDEFAVILPGANAAASAQALVRILNLVELNNSYYGPPTLSFSLGSATGETGPGLADALREADDRMYVEKRLHYGSHPVDE